MVSRSLSHTMHHRWVLIYVEGPLLAGSGYTDLWIANAATIVAGTTAAHLTHNLLLVNGRTGADVVYTSQV
jgi:hypothetical protein